MNQEFRIKEVKVGLTEGSISTKFYPQVLKFRKKVPMWKFWVKQDVIEKWETFYEDSTGNIQQGLPGGFSINPRNIIVFSSLKLAASWLEQYKSSKNREIEEYISQMENKIGATMDPVAIHPIQ